jgi:tetratricopeptide (TPR) repeat protein
MSLASSGVKYYLLCLAVLAVAGAAFVWLAEPAVPPPPEIDTSRVAPAIAKALDDGYADCLADPKSGRLRGHLGMFRQASRLDPRQFRWKYYLGVLCEDQNLTEAVDSFKQASFLRSDYAPLWQRMAECQVRLNRIPQARASYSTAARLAPDSPIPLLGLARLEAAQNQLPEAVAWIEQALQVAPESREVLQEKIGLLRARGDNVAAARLQERIDAFPPAPRVMPDEFLAAVDQLDLSSNRLAKMADLQLASGDLAAASESLKRLIFDRPDLPMVRINLGQIRLREGNLPAAIAIFRETVSGFPHEPGCRFALGNALEAAGELDEALEMYSQATEIKPDYAEALYRKGRVLLKLRRVPEAISALRAALASNPALVLAQVDLARAYAARGAWTEALDAADIAARLAPGDAQVRELQQSIRDRKIRGDSQP